jgi:predicted permease
MATLIQDLRYALRMLARNPGFTLVAVVTLALGIGANTAIFTVVNALLLKMLPVKDPQQLVVVGDPTAANSRSHGTPQTGIFSYPLYQELRDKNDVFSGLCAAATDHRIEVDAVSAGGSSGDRIVGRMVSGNYFPLLGVHAAAGRLFTEKDETEDHANPLVVLGYGYWKRKFALSPPIVGKSIRLNGYPFTIIGVTQPGFAGDVVGEEMEVFVPLSMQPEIIRGYRLRQDANSSWLSLIGRLKPGITAAHAEANLNLVFRQALKGSYAALLSSDDRNALSEPDVHIQVVPGGGGLSEFRGAYRIPLLLLMGIVGLVLLIACVNVANLLLARATTRVREVALRLAIGASRRRLIQQLLTESILLAFLGGIGGVLLSIWGVEILVNIFENGASLPLTPDLRVLAFTTAVCLVTGILFGLAPVLRLLRVQVSPALKTAAAAAPEGRSRLGWGRGLVSGQVALSLLVLFAAGLLVRSLQKLMAQSVGYDPGRIVIARLNPVAGGYKDAKIDALAERLVARISALPGVRGVTYSENGLFSGTESADAILVPGFPAAKPGDRVANEDSVGPDYFAVVGIPILLGRGIGPEDTATSTRVAVINEAMVKRFFQGGNPLGRQFSIDDPDWKGKPFTVVGVSMDAKDHSLRKAVAPRFYYAFQQYRDTGQIILEVSVTGSASAAVAEIQSQIKAADPNLPISFIHPLPELVKGRISDQIALAKLSAFFAGLSLLLACVGLYGIMSYTVAGRTREIGVRMALGAEPGDVLELVLREGMLLVGVGLAAGIPLSLAGSRVLASFLFGLTSTDPLSLIAVMVLLGIVAAVAAFIPARRAAKVDPMVALRYE